MCARIRQRLYYIGIAKSIFVRQLPPYLNDLHSAGKMSAHLDRGHLHEASRR